MISSNELNYQISYAEISSAINELEYNKSLGLDKITNNIILKCNQTFITTYLMRICNACLTYGIYPWNECYVKPLYKNRNFNDPNNYRGLTITASIEKLFSSILNTRLDNFFVEKHNLIDDCNIGFTHKARTSDHVNS